MRRTTLILALLVLLASLLLRVLGPCRRQGEGRLGADRQLPRPLPREDPRGRTGGVRSGELTMFIQEEYPGSEEPAGHPQAADEDEQRRRLPEGTEVARQGAHRARQGRRLPRPDDRQVRRHDAAAGQDRRRRVSTHGLGQVKARLLPLLEEARPPRGEPTRMRFRFLLLGTAVLAAAIVLAACGGGSSRASPHTTRLQGSPGNHRLAPLRPRPRQHALRDPGRNRHRQRRRTG